MKNAWHFLFLNVKWQFAKGIFVLYITVMILIMYIFFYTDRSDQWTVTIETINSLSV